MPIYDRPTKALMAEWAKEYLKPSQNFSKSDPERWFAENYPRIKRNTVHMHVEGMSVNNRNRKHHPNIRVGTGHDLFYKLGPNQFRLWDEDSDPAPLYKEDIEQQDASNSEENYVGSQPDTEPSIEATQEFAFERDLQNYLVKNLDLIETGLCLYEEEGLTGVEFSAGGRFIDIFAVDKEGNFVVIELKVSRGYDRVIGQLLRYMAWVEENMADNQRVRGIIVANDITTDLKLAASRIPDVQLVEYEISFKLRQVSHD